MRILIQGLGCTETGARIVLRELLQAAPVGNDYVVLCTADSAREFIGRSCGRMGSHVHVIGLSHKLFGRFLRVPLELILALLNSCYLFDKIINLSHYGLCISRRYALYVHSPLLMDVSHARGWGDGRPNFLKKWMLDTCIRRARPFILQTWNMKVQLAGYCEMAKLPLPKSRVMRPKVVIERPDSSKRAFQFQLFYPTSRFSHKRADLALEAGRLAYSKNDHIGLVITVNPATNQLSIIDGVLTVGRISREDVYAWFSGSDALLFTSERETLGLPLLEALEFGLPVIAPRLPYAEEILGEAGCYFDEPTPIAVAEAILRCRDSYTTWQAKIKVRAREMNRDAATWAEHWKVFLNNN